MNLTPQERRELLDLLEQLSQAMDGNALWPNQIRDILRELHARVVAWLGDEDTETVSHQHSAGGGGGPCEE
ncbi:hypothetical protein FHX37_0286 [Haloactinospora alba]|uniref:Uncharacterized protein n=1 Tax=Haloactinospora alba TaxID=405555 RepID=A0A543NEZ5_9ACTN|nr:hypothetical protein [Haloactinospora alba]TQN30408.1 hypothetical protein FHX37_0286 [Haloactinospora alba]